MEMNISEPHPFDVVLLVHGQIFRVEKYVVHHEKAERVSVNLQSIGSVYLRRFKSCDGNGIQQRGCKEV